MANVPHFMLRTGVINAAQSRQVALALDMLEKSPMHLYNPQDFTAERMCAITRKLVRQHGIKAVFLDHVQVLKVGKELREGLTRASICIRDCCSSTGVPHVILAHVNRDAAGKSGAKAMRPRPEDIKEFDQLYGDCDAMAMLWTEQKPEDIDPGAPLEVNLYAAKNRSGPLTEEHLNFNRPLMHFSDR
jgi:replicative DNA helicase